MELASCSRDHLTADEDRGMYSTLTVQKANGRIAMEERSVVRYFGGGAHRAWRMARRAQRYALCPRVFALGAMR